MPKAEEKPGEPQVPEPRGRGISPETESDSSSVFSRITARLRRMMGFREKADQDSVPTPIPVAVPASERIPVPETRPSRPKKLVIPREDQPPASSFREKPLGFDERIIAPGAREEIQFEYAVQESESHFATLRIGDKWKAFLHRVYPPTEKEVFSIDEVDPKTGTSNKKSIWELGQRFPLGKTAIPIPEVGEIVFEVIDHKTVFVTAPGGESVRIEIPVRRPKHMTHAQADEIRLEYTRERLGLNETEARRHPREIMDTVLLGEKVELDATDPFVISVGNDLLVISPNYQRLSRDEVRRDVQFPFLIQIPGCRPVRLRGNDVTRIQDIGIAIVVMNERTVRVENESESPLQIHACAEGKGRIEKGSGAVVRRKPGIKLFITINGKRFSVDETRTEEGRVLSVCEEELSDAGMGHLEIVLSPGKNPLTSIAYKGITIDVSDDMEYLRITNGHEEYDIEYELEEEKREGDE